MEISKLSPEFKHPSLGLGNLSLANDSQPGLLLSWHAARAVVVAYYSKTGLMEVGSAAFEFHVMAVALTLPPFNTSSWIR